MFIIGEIDVHSSYHFDLRVSDYLSFDRIWRVVWTCYLYIYFAYPSIL